MNTWRNLMTFKQSQNNENKMLKNDCSQKPQKMILKMKKLKVFCMSWISAHLAFLGSDFF